ncbi:MAG: hypothetical protein ACI4A5_04305, partial [Hominilimicola sp.]
VLENDNELPLIRVNTNESEDGRTVVEFLEYTENDDGSQTAAITAKIETDGVYAIVYLKNESGEFYCLREVYGHIEQVIDFSDAEDSVELLKKIREYLKENRFDKMKLEVSAVDLHYLSDCAEPLKILDRMRCISYPHGMNTLFTVTELSIELDKPDSAQYTLEKTLNYSSTQSSSLSGAISAVSSEIESSQSTILLRAKSNADKILREKTNGYVTLVTDTDGGRHSEALVISSGKDYKKSEHFWIWNVNGLGHYTETGDDTAFEADEDDEISKWLDKYVLNVGITMDGAIVANRITVGHMSADRVRTGVLMSQDGNVVWNLNATDTYVVEMDKTYPGGSMTIKKGSIALGESFGNWDGAFCVDDSGDLHAEKGNIGGFVIESDNIHNDGMRLDSEGLHMYRDVKTDMGFLGISYWEEQPSYKALAMNMENEGSAIWWAYRQNRSDETFTVKLLYAADEFDAYKADTLYVHCALDLRGCTARNFNIDSSNGGAERGLSGYCLLLTGDAINDDGTINESKLQEVYVQNGFIVSGP